MTIGPGYAMAAGSGSGGIRASDADRERAVEVLKAGFTEGRLPKDEYDARVHRAYTAPTRADLEQVTAQLPGGGAALYMVARRRTNPLAIASLACGVGQPFTAGLSTIPAIVLGHVARGQIRRSGEEGAGLALAGVLLGWAGMALIVITVAAVVVAAVVLTHGAPSG
jgi:uncharacterized membrane protein